MLLLSLSFFWLSDHSQLSFVYEIQINSTKHEGFKMLFGVHFSHKCPYGGWVLEYDRQIGEPLK